LNNILISKRNSAILLGMLLLLGTIATILPSVQAAPYYKDRYYTQGYEHDYPTSQDNNYYKSKDNSVNVNKIKCNNINVNVNGLDFNVFPSFLGDSGLAAEAADEVNTDASSFTGNGANGNISKINDFRFICINNNNNTFVGVDNEEPTPPGPTTANLNVTKLVTCQQEDRNGLVPSIQQISLDCDDLLNIITEDQFNISVTDTNVSPSNFKGSETGTLVTLDAGPFTVKEEPDDSVAADVATIEDIQTNVTGPIPSFSGDCTQTGTGSFSATGDIAAASQETCNIVNNFVINVIDPCQGCFRANNALQAVIEGQLVKQTVDFGFVVGSDNLVIPNGVDTIEQLCPLLKGHTDALIDSIISTIVLIQTGSTTAFQTEIDALIKCLLEAGVIVEANAGLTTSNINTAGGLTPSFSSPPTITQGTEASPKLTSLEKQQSDNSPELTATEKITKLKQQWLELLP